MLGPFQMVRLHVGMGATETQHRLSRRGKL